MQPNSLAYDCSGYDVYLVGRCIWDHILKKTPKDFNIITSAEVKQVISVYIYVAFAFALNFILTSNLLFSL